MTSNAYVPSEAGQENTSSEQQTRAPNRAKARYKALRKRASWACHRCRERKVRCNVMAHGAPCVNCRLDKVNCLVTERRRPRKLTYGNEESPKPQLYPVNESFQDLMVSSVDILALVNNTLRPFDVINTPSWREYNSGQYISDSVENTHALEWHQAYHDFWYWPDNLYNHRDANTHRSDAPSDFEAASFPDRYQTKSKPTLVPQNRHCLLPDYIRRLPNTMDDAEISHLQRTGSLLVPERRLRNALLESYIEFVHPYMPVIELHDFIRIISGNRGEAVSLLLFQAVMFAGCAFVDMAYLMDAGFMSRKEARKALYQRAKMLYELDYEMDRVTIVQSLLLMTYWYETPYDHKDSLHWLSIAVSLAYTAGLHRDRRGSALSAKKQRLWKRIWWSGFMRDRLVAFGTRGTTRIDAAHFDVRMLTLDDFEIESLGADYRTISAECTLMRDKKLQRDLAELCIAQARLCLLVSPALLTQSPMVVNQQGTTHGQESNMHPYVMQSQEERARIEDTNQCYARLRGWIENLPIPCRYQVPTESDVESGRSCVIVQRALLHMLFSAIISNVKKQQFLQTTEVVTYDSKFSSPPYVPDDRVRIAANQITSISKDLIGLKLERYLPPSGITALLYAITVHVLDIKSPDSMVSQNATLGFNECVTVMESLRTNYPSADYACRFLDVIKQQVQFDNTKTNKSDYESGSRHSGSPSDMQRRESITSQANSHDTNTEPYSYRVQGTSIPMQRDMNFSRVPVGNRTDEWRNSEARDSSAEDFSLRSTGRMTIFNGKSELDTEYGNTDEGIESSNSEDFECVESFDLGVEGYFEESYALDNRASESHVGSYMLASNDRNDLDYLVVC